MGEPTKRVEINLLEEVKNRMPSTLIKDLQEDERICPYCGGLGMVIHNNEYGLKGDDSELGKAYLFPYKHQALSFCPHCYNGIQKICVYCGNPYPNKDCYHCNCEGYREQEKSKAAKKYRESILNAKEVSESSVQTMLYCSENDKYYESVDDFFDKYEDEDFDEKPTVLWVCSVEEVSLNAYEVLSAWEDLYEDVLDNYDIKALQRKLDEWCDEQTGTIYCPNYNEYVKINWNRKR